MSAAEASQVRAAGASSMRVRLNALDLALYRRARSMARTPETVRWVKRYSHLGEHGML